MFKVLEIHLKNYLPKTIKKYGHAYLHGDGNIYVDKTTDEQGNPVQLEHQRTQIARTYAAHGNESATYVLYLTHVNQIPENVEACEKALLAAKAQENAEKYRTKTNDNFLSIESDEPEEKVSEEKETKKPGRPAKADKE
jgi:hypothetical protein